MRGRHQQDMDGWRAMEKLSADALRDARVSRASDLGRTPSTCLPGRADRRYLMRVRQPFATRRNSSCAIQDVAAEVPAAFATAGQYRESVALRLEKSFEWQVENEENVIHTKSTASRPLTEEAIPSASKSPTRAPAPNPSEVPLGAIQDAEHLSSSRRRQRRIEPAHLSPQFPDSLRRRGEARAGRRTWSRTMSDLRAPVGLKKRRKDGHSCV